VYQPRGSTDQASGRRRPSRPPIAGVVATGLVATLGLRALRWFLDDRIGSLLGWLAVTVLVVGGVGLFRGVARSRRRRGSDEDFRPELVQKFVADSGVGPPTFPGDGTLMGESILVVSQRTKAIEVVGEYRVLDHMGSELAIVRQFGQNRLKRFFRFFGGFSIFFTHRFEVTDPQGRALGSFVRPRKVFVSRVEIYDAVGVHAGTLRQENVFGHIRFRLEAPGGVIVAMMRARNWRAWDFSIVDHTGAEIAVIIKTWEGWARTFLTTADRYVVRIARPLEDPLHTLVVASALAIDVALKQDPRGLTAGG
jgi:uncharacterized protein YxjI